MCSLFIDSDLKLLCLFMYFSVIVMELVVFLGNCMVVGVDIVCLNVVFVICIGVNVMLYVVWKWYLILCIMCVVRNVLCVIVIGVFSCVVMLCILKCVIEYDGKGCR